MRRLLYINAALLALVGCSSGGDNGPTVDPVVPTIGISVSPASVTAARGASATATVSLVRGGNYTGAVQLAASNVPTGVTVTFNPSTLSSSTSSATATVTVGSGAASGTQSIQLTASGSGVTSANATLALEVPNPAIALAVGAPTLSVVQGASGTIALTITRSGGFTGDVTVAASGLPAGVTAQAVTIASGSTSGTMTVNVGATAATATTPITLTASGTGVTAQTSTVNLTVTAAATPTFSISASPAAVTVTAGQSATSTITITRSGGFAGAVAVAVNGAPAGITATLNPTSIAAGATTSQLTIATTSAVTPGTYSFSVTGSGTGVTDRLATLSVTVTAPAGISIATSSGAVAATAGGTVSTGVTLTRSGGYAGDVTLAVTGLPSGASAAFAPATLSGATTASTLTLTVGASVAAGTYPLSVNAAGPQAGGNLTASANLTLTVTAAQSYSLSATSVSLTQGASATSTVTITRNGGFNGAVALSVSGLPSGVTGTFNPASATGTTSTLTLTATTGAATGAFTATISGTATGAPNATATLTGSVATGGGGGTGNIAWTFCDTERFPVWFAVQNGNGAWTQVMPTGTTNRVYSFNMNSSGGVAYAIPQSGNTGTDVTVMYLGAQEMSRSAESECETAPGGFKTLTGTVAGLSTNPLSLQSAMIWVGFSGGSANANGPFTVERARGGVTDLLAIRSSMTIGGPGGYSNAADKVILRRDVNYTSTIPALDFAGSEAFNPITAQYSITNLSAGQNLFATSMFSTANGTAGSFSSVDMSGTSPVTVYGIPASKLQSGDQHMVLIAASTTAGQVATSQRIMYQVNHELTNRSLALGAELPTVSPTTIANAPYRRLSVSVAKQSDYADAIGVGYTPTTSNGNSWTVNMTATYAGNPSTWKIDIPDFSGVAGFQSSWGLGNTATTWTVTASGSMSGINPLTGKYNEGANWKAASRSGSVNISGIRSK